MFKKTLKLLLSYFLSFNLVVLPAFGDSIQVEERTLDKIDTFLKAGKPSDIPFIDYIESFTYDNVQPLKNFDLSKFIGKKIFLGYGIYDREQNFCKYVERPGMEDPNLYFQKHITYNRHTYALSFNPMNYDTCVDLASKFNGIPASITSPSENAFISSMFPGKSKWLGIERPNCVEEYLNKDGLTQNYFNWSTLGGQSGECNESSLNIAQNQYGTWNKQKSQELNYCLVEIDTEEITRPIKICAPWWRIEREYKKETETTFYGVDVYKINQADIPEQFTVCTKFDEVAIKNTLEQPFRDVTCTSYYDSVIAEECLRNPMQNICFVDECNGYIKNACRLKEVVEPFKNYTKTETIQGGANIVSKGKVGIKTHVYSCPPSLPSLNSCLESSNVIIFPQECPSSDCEGYNKCVQDSSSIDEKNKCSDKHVCEKIYGNPDNVVYGPDGNLQYLKGKCSDGTELLFEPSIQSRNAKKCLEYEYYTIEEEVSQRCVLERPYNDYVVDTSLTEIDAYMNNPSCIRLNNISEARPTVKLTISAKNFGFAITSLKKSYLDETEGERVSLGADEMFEAAVNTTIGNDLDIVSSVLKEDIPQIQQDFVNSNSNIQQRCSEFYPSVPMPPMTPGSLDWDENNTGETEEDYPVEEIEQKPFFTEIKKYLNDITKITVKEKKEIPHPTNPFLPPTIVEEDVTYTFKAIYLGKEEDGRQFIKFDKVKTEEMCSMISENKDGVEYNYQEVPKVCTVYIESQGLEPYAFIQGQGTYSNGEYENYILNTTEAIDEETCQEKAFCLDGVYNVNAYGNIDVTQCEIKFGESYSFIEDEYEWIDTNTGNEERDENCVPRPTDFAYQSQLDGTSDIFSIQEVSNGAYEDFGYYSNYNAHPYKSNIVSINGKQVAPIKEIPIIMDALVYEGKFMQKSIQTKKPNFKAGAVGGAAAGVAAAAYIAYGGAMAGIAGGVAAGGGAVTAGMAASIGANSAAAIAGAEAAAAGGSAATAGASTALAAFAAIAIIVIAIIVVFVLVTMLMGKQYSLNEQNIKWKIYKLIPISRYIPSQLGAWKKESNKQENYKNYTNRYDHRIRPETKGDFVKIYYADTDIFTGTHKKNDFLAFLNDTYNSKVSLLTCMGWFKSDVANITHGVETQVLVPFPKCKSFSFSCNKSNSQNFNHNVNPFFKRMNNSYIAATNSVSIIIPYLGNYELKAYNKEGNLLSTMTVKENEFIETTADVSRYAQVFFGLGMGLADGIREGTNTNACRYDLMTEWGGGVSGIYYENNNTGTSKDCQKSHDGYVRENSATRITVRALNSDREHIIDLEKRLPFPNRVFLVTLNEKELREYRCFEDFGECSSENYTTE